MIELLQRIFHEKDPVTSQFPLLGSPKPVLTLTAFYLWFVFFIGPAYMKHRKPYNLRRIILIYNVLQIIINFVLCFYVVIVLIMQRAHIDDIFCLAKFPESHPLRRVDYYTLYIYYLLKVVDYVETCFFVLRKSYKQVSFLHLYHHVMMVLFVYYLATYNGAASQYLMVIICNTAIHAFMYTYYFLAAFQTQVKQSLWWKKYITILQLIQFVILLVHNAFPLLFRPQCKVTKGLLYFAVSQALVMIFLFTKFYIKAYVIKKQPIQRENYVNAKKELKQN